MVTATASLLEGQVGLGALRGRLVKESRLRIEGTGAEDLAIPAGNVQAGRSPEERGAKASEGRQAGPDAAILSRWPGDHGCRFAFPGPGRITPQRRS